MKIEIIPSPTPTTSIPCLTEHIPLRRKAGASPIADPVSIWKKRTLLPSSKTNFLRTKSTDNQGFADHAVKSCLFFPCPSWKNTCLAPCPIPFWPRNCCWSVQYFSVKFLEGSGRGRFIHRKADRFFSLS